VLTAAIPSAALRCLCKYNHNHQIIIETDGCCSAVFVAAVPAVDRTPRDPDCEEESGGEISMGRGEEQRSKEWNSTGMMRRICIITHNNRQTARETRKPTHDAQQRAQHSTAEEGGKQTDRRRGTNDTIRSGGVWPHHQRADMASDRRLAGQSSSCARGCPWSWAGTCRPTVRTVHTLWS
jgi:hypothetical protein